VGDALFVHLYVVGALLASVGHVAYGLVSGSPAPALGASGAVMTVAVVYAALFPRRTLMINFFIPVPAVLAVAGYVLLDLFGMLGGNKDGVAHAAHLGGAVYGFLFWLLWLRRRVVRVG
jgi:membrane associated rhomboid family serine protease